MKKFQLVCIARVQHKCEKCKFAFSAVFSSFQVLVSWNPGPPLGLQALMAETLQWVWHKQFSFYGPLWCDDSKHGKQLIHCPCFLFYMLQHVTRTWRYTVCVFSLTCCSMWSQLLLPVVIICPIDSCMHVLVRENERFWILVEDFEWALSQITLVSTYYQGPPKYPSIWIVHWGFF